MSEIRTKGSLCTGTAALDLAAPGELKWLAETAPAPSAVLKREHPDVPNLGDITTTWLDDMAGVDLITSGDPCQSLSVAGRQRASDDSRFLWPDVKRVLYMIRPQHVFLENVAAITSARLKKDATDWRGEKGSVLRMRLDDLREMGYATRWTVLGACAVGAPHHRHRWFLRATYVGQGAAPEAVCVPTPIICTRRNLLPSPAARDGNSRGEGSPEFWARKRATRPTQGIPLGAEVNLLPADGSWARFAPAIRFWEDIIGRPVPEPTVPRGRGGHPRLNPALSEWMMGYPAGYLTQDASINEALTMAGNGVVTRQAEAAWELLG